jgi:hypothetical protein
MFCSVHSYSRNSISLQNPLSKLLCLTESLVQYNRIVQKRTIPCFFQNLARQHNYETFVKRRKDLRTQSSDCPNREHATKFGLCKNNKLSPLMPHKEVSTFNHQNLHDNDTKRVRNITWTWVL